MTSPSPVYPRYLSADGTAWRRFERDDRAPGGGTPVPPGPWTPGVTEPVLTNQFGSGGTPNCGIRVLRATLTVVTGTVHAAGTTQYNLMEFSGHVIVDSGAPSFVDCYFSSGDYNSKANAQVDCRASGVTGVLFDFCHFIPTVPSAWIDGVIGHHYTLRRSVIRHTCDGFGSYNTSGGAVNVHVEGCYIYELAWFYPDPDTAAHPNDSTHNDGGQHQAGAGLWVIGNAIHAYVVSYLGTLSTNNTSGSPPNYNQAGQILMIQWNSGAGVKPSDIHVTDNWLYGGANGVTVRNLLAGVEIKRNHFMDNGQKQDGSHANYIRCSSGQVINGISYATGFHTVSGVDAPVVWGFTGTDAFGVAHTIGDPIVNGIRVP